MSRLWEENLMRRMEKINEQNKFPDKLREGSKAIEVLEDATEENPLGLQLSEEIRTLLEIEGEKEWRDV